MGEVAGVPPFVGRTAEVRRLEAAFARVRDGEPMTCCVGGEAGVGKTRLVTSFAGLCADAGAQVLAGGCLELREVSVPYAPVAQALRGLCRELEPAALDAVVGPDRPVLARLLPELARDEAGAASAGADGSSQARLFEAVLGLLERLADRSPTVLVVEDLHWADGSTLDLLTFLVRNVRAAVLLVLTYRSDELHGQHWLRPFLAGLARSAGVERLELGRFGRDEVERLMTGILGTRPEPDAIDRIHRRSDGNAFFVEELLAGDALEDPRELPPSLENVLLTRIHVLPEETQATLRLVAVAGGRVEHRLLAVVSELPEPDLLAALRLAVADHVLVADPVDEVYAFRHALTQEALYAQLLPGERTRLHTALGTALGDHPELAEPNRLAVPARLAHHWQQAREPARALPAAVEAAARSSAALGFSESHRHLETALELWDRAAEATEQLDVDRTTLLQRAADAAYLAADPSRAIALTRAAIDSVDESADPVRAGLLRAGLAGYLRATGGEGVLDEYEAAVRLVPSSSPCAERAQVLAAFAEALAGAGRYRESRAMCEESVAIAVDVGARAEEGDARRALGVDLAFLGDLPAGVRELHEARRISEAVGRVDNVARAFASLSGLQDAFGDLEGALATALEGAEFAAVNGLGRWHGPFLTATAGRAHFALGHWDEADLLLRSAADRVAPGLAATRVYLDTARADVELARGRVDSAAGYLGSARAAYRRTVTQSWFAAPLFAAAARLDLAEGRLDDADSAVAEGLRVAGADPVFGPLLFALGLRAAADRAEHAVARRADDEARAARRAGGDLADRLQHQLSDHRAEGVVATPRTEAVLALCEAEGARLAGETDPRPWAVAATAWARMGERLPAAHARCREAEAMLLSGRGRQDVEAVLREAHRAATRLGADPLRREVEALARRGRLSLAADQTATAGPANKPTSQLDRLGLTAREADVLSLIAVGRTNRQIAQALFISPKTAGVHVSSILAKLGVHSRVEAATTAHRLGLVAPGP